MRLTLLMLATLVLAGCSSDAPRENASAEGPVDDAAPPAPPVRRATSDLGSHSFAVVAPTLDGFFHIDVPEGARNVTARAEGTGLAISGFTVRLEGCGEATHPTTSGVAQGAQGFELCGEAEPGRQEVRVTVTTGAFRGRVSLQADVPVA
jgi:hypothetical protein